MGYKCAWPVNNHIMIGSYGTANGHSSLPLLVVGGRRRKKKCVCVVGGGGH